jgi:exodeoxyribonuclease (lambda-induced)
MLAPMDIPSISRNSFKKYQDLNETTIHTSMKKTMKKAVEEEKRLAIDANNIVTINDQVYPVIKVIVDGSWAKRSYGHSYDSNYGTAAVIGYRTRKVLDCRVRVKYCFFCTRYRNAGIVPKHKCYKNFSQPSTSMEQDIIYECFSNSIETYGVVYGTFIGDGDSSVFSKVKNVYNGIEVRKIECVNHVVRNLNSKLTAISNNKVKRGIKNPQSERQFPGMEERFRRVGKSVMSAILHYNELQNHVENWQYLMEDILNIPNHTFGRHDNCKQYYCKRRGTEPDLIPQVESMATFVLLKEAISRVANLSESLIEKETSNIVESFMSTVAKYLEGKRINLGGKNLYNIKISTAVLSFNTSSFWGLDAYKLAFGKSPNMIWTKRKNETLQRRLAQLTRPKVKTPRQLTFGFLKEKGDKFYGSNPESGNPDLPADALGIRIEALRNDLKVDLIRQQQIEERTRNQALDNQWFEERRRRITASVAGTIVKLRPNTDNTCTLRTILRTRHISSKSLEYGKDTEDLAISKYEQVYNLEPGTVKKCGLVVCSTNGIFGASPDGLIGEDGIIEVKCPYTIRFEDPNNWASKKNSPLKVVNGELQLSRKHNYYFQVVMQLFVTQRQWCDFFVYTTVGTFTERIFWNPESIEIWKTMKEKLETFWIEDLAPEIVDSRLGRGYKDFKCSVTREQGRKRKMKD